jgi:hypothetical protein
MRDDQYLRLQQLEEKLTEQFLSEADPVNWSAEGILPKNMTQAERGDRYWCKKNAVATISLTIRIGSLIGMVQRRGDTDPAAPGDDETDPTAGLLDREVAEAEKEAKRLLNQFAKKNKATAG